MLPPSLPPTPPRGPGGGGGGADLFVVLYPFLVHLAIIRNNNEFRLYQVM
jgi:hypothetical protein